MTIEKVFETFRNCFAEYDLDFYNNDFNFGENIAIFLASTV